MQNGNSYAIGRVGSSNTNPISFPDTQSTNSPVKERRILGGRYALINFVDRKEAQLINQATGIPIVEAALERSTVDKAKALAYAKLGTIAFSQGETIAKPILGQGGFGKFRLAMQLKNKTYIGVKKIKQADAMLASENEAVIQQKLAHKPHIMPLFDSIRDKSTKTQQPVLYQFMPLACLGGNVHYLGTHLAKLTDAHLKECVIIHIASSLLLGLWHMHQLGIYHLDIKPANMVVNQEGEVFIIDFGCAIELQQRPPLFTAIYDAQGRPIKGGGDTYYFSPERFEAAQETQPFDCEKADIWAAGVSLGELLTGKQIIDPRTAPPLSSKPGSIENLIGQLLTNNPQKRLNAEQALNHPIFQQQKVHDNDFREVVITYLRKFVENTREKTYTSHTNSPSMSAYGLATKQAEVDGARPVITSVPQSESIQQKKVDDRIAIQQLKNRLLHPFADRPDILEQLALYVPLQASEEKDGKDPFELETAIQKFLQGEKNTLLLLADGGSGKSLFCQHLTQQLTDPNNNNGWLPIYIPLGGIQNPKRLLEEIFMQRYGFNEDQMVDLRENRRFLFILDGYDEMRQAVNLYLENQLQMWQAKLLITCRPNALAPDYLTYFLPYDVTKQVTKQSLVEWYVISFSNEKINQYAANYVKVQQPRLTQAVNDKQLDVQWLEASSYQQNLKELPGLLELTTSPFLLYLTMQVLPRLAKRTSNEKITSGDLFETFIEGWNQKQKDKGNVQVTLQEVWDFGQNLAEAMYTQIRVQVHYAPLWSFNPQKQRYETEFNEWSPFFNDQDPKVKALRQYLPIKLLAENTYGFIHLSILEYLLARKWYHELKALGLAEQKNQALQLSLSKYVLTRDDKNQRVLQFLSEWVWPDHLFKTLLFAALEGSKKEPALATLAANSITILNRARVSFAELNLSGIQIPGADLSGANLDSANLTAAHLEKVRLHKTWLRQTVLTKANLTAVDFGERPIAQYDDPVIEISYSLDGRFLAVATGKKVIVEDLQSGQQKILTGHTRNVRSVAWSSQGKLASGSIDATVIIWDPETGKALQTLTRIAKFVECVAWSPQGLLASGNEDKTVVVWDWVTGQPLQILTGHEDVVTCVAWSPQSVLASGSWDRTVIVWDLKKGKELQIFLHHNASVESVAWSLQGILASGSDDKTIIVWDLEKGKPLQTLIGHTDKVRTVAWSLQSVLASASDDQTIIVWDLEKGKPLQTFTGHTALVTSATWSPQSMLTAGSRDKTVTMWNLEKGKAVQTFIGHTHPVISVTCSPQTGLISQSEGHIFIVWDLEKGKVFQTLTRFADWVGDVACFSQGLLASRSKNDIHTVIVCDLKKGKVVQTLTGHSSFVHSVAWSPQGMLASICRDKIVIVWDLEKGKALHTLTGHTSSVDDVRSPSVENVAWSPQGLLASASNKSIIIWNLEKGKPLHSLTEPNAKVGSIAWSPQSLLASGSHDGIVIVWDLEKEKPLHTLAGHTGKVNCVAWSSQDVLASGSEDHTIIVWDLENGRPDVKLNGYLGFVTSISWVQKDQQTYLVTGSRDHSVKVWHHRDHGQKQNSFQLLWSSHALSLYAEGCQIDGVQGLSAEQVKLLKQKKAVGEPTVLIQTQNTN